MIQVPVRTRFSSAHAVRPLAFATLCTLVMSGDVSFTTIATADDAAQQGAKLFTHKCARCHGDKGQGTEDHYDEPLIGDRSVKELTEIITETMPEDAPEEIVGDDARQVAEYIHDAFYSEIAQARNQPARIEFSRLTARQSEQSIADLMQTFRGSREMGEQRGLEAEYYDSKNRRRDRRTIERIDATVDFDFGETNPAASDNKQNDQNNDNDKKKKSKPKDEEDAFSVRWVGGVRAPETGDYEFIIETENGARLWVNDDEHELIDAWVKSGDETEYRASIRLLAGHVYPVILEFFRFREPTASIHLKWKPPEQATTVIPQRLLSPERYPPVTVITTPFPPDDRSTGYVRGTSISAEWDQAATYAALEVAERVLDDLNRLARTKDDADDRPQKLREFAGRFVERAFRRPLSLEERQFFVDRIFEEAESPEAAIKHVVVLALKSPRFLYRETGRQTMDDYAIASWISFALWDTLPDERLLKAAEQGQLQSRDKIEAQVQRMLSDLRTRAKLQEFFHAWLKVDYFQKVSKDRELFPGFTPEIVSDLRTSLDLTLDEIVWGGAADFRQLLLGDSIQLNEPLAEFYGVNASIGEGFAPVKLPSRERAGVLSHPYLMAGFAHDDTTSPIHRGVFIARNLLGRRLRPPPDAFSPLPPEDFADLSTRERIAMQTRPAACQTCHSMINPLGFSLENFDAVGRFREQETAKPVNATGYYITREGERVEFSGARELAEFLADSPEAQEAFIEHLFQYMMKQPVRAFGDDTLAQLREFFVTHNYNIRELLVEIVTMTADELRNDES